MYVTYHVKPQVYYSRSTKLEFVSLWVVPRSCFNQGMLLQALTAGVGESCYQLVMMGAAKGVLIAVKFEVLHWDGH